MDATHVQGRGPAVPRQAQLGDPLVGPAGDNRLAGGVARRVVVVATLRAGLGIAPRPHADIDGEDRRCLIAEQMVGKQATERVGIHRAPCQSGIQTAPPATMDGFQTQVDRRRHRATDQQCVTQFEQGIAPSPQAGIDGDTEVTQQSEGIGWYNHSRLSLPEPVTAWPLGGWLPGGS